MPLGTLATLGTPIGWGLMGLGAVGSLLTQHKANKAQNKLMREYLEIMRQNMAEDKRRWTLEDTIKQNLTNRLNENSSQMRRKVENMLPMFEQERNDLNRRNEQLLQTSDGRSVLNEPNDIRELLLNMLKNELITSQNRKKPSFRGVNETMDNHRRFLEEFRNFM